MWQILNERVMSKLGYAHARLIKLTSELIMNEFKRVINEFLMSKSRVISNLLTRTKVITNKFEFSFRFLPAKQCDYFKIINSKKKVTSSQHIQILVLP